MQQKYKYVTNITKTMILHNTDAYSILDVLDGIVEKHCGGTHYCECIFTITV